MSKTGNHFTLSEVDAAKTFKETFLQEEEEAAEAAPVAEREREDKKQSKDNRDLCDDSASQKLDRESIEMMKSEGKSGEEIMESLIANSSSFKDKTTFSQEKFLKKKSQKYYPYICVRKPSIRLLIDIYYKNDPIKIMNLRIDSLGLLLNHLNICQGDGKYLIYEGGSHGVITAAALERLGSVGGSRIIQMYTSGLPQTQAVSAMNFPPEIVSKLLPLNLHHFRALSKGQKIMTEEMEAETSRHKLRQQSLSAFNSIQSEKLDGFILATRQHPTNLLLTFFEHLKPSKSFAVFCPYKEPLMEAYIALKETGRAVMVQLAETWLRNYQTLPERTHPEMTMSGGGGYILSGIAVK